MLSDFVITVGGKVGDSDIAEMWKLYCAKYNEESRATLTTPL